MVGGNEVAEQCKHGGVLDIRNTGNLLREIGKERRFLDVGGGGIKLVGRTG